MERVNTGGLTEIRYEKGHKQQELSKKEKEELKKAYERGKRKQAQIEKEEAERQRQWKNRWKRYNLWKAIKPYLIGLILILILFYVLKRII
jgi:hypothetical protein